MFLAHYLIGVVQMAITVIFGSVFLKKWRLTRWTAGLACFAAPLLFTSVNLLQIPWINTAAAAIVSVAILLLAFCEKWQRVVLVGLVAAVLVVLCELITTIICTVVLKINVIEMMQREILAVITTSISTITFFLLVLITRLVAQLRAKKGGDTLVTNRYVVIILPVLSILIGYYVMYASTIIQDSTLLRLGLILYLAMLVAVAAILFGTENDRRRFRLQRDREEMESQTAYLTQLTIQQEAHLQELRAQAHDYKNHLLTLQLMLHQADEAHIPQKPRQYVQDALDTLGNVTDFSRVQNKALEVLLSKTARECLQNGIRFETDIEYADFNFLSYQDLSALVFNALDNAVFACRQMDVEAHERYIEFSSWLQNEIVYLHVVNSKTNSIRMENGNFISTKRSSHSHAIGMKNIKRIAQKHGGDVHIEYTENEFQLYIHLPLVQNS